MHYKSLNKEYIIMEKLNENLFNNKHIIKGLKENLTSTINTIYVTTSKLLNKDVRKIMKDHFREVLSSFDVDNTDKKNNVSFIDLLLSLEKMNKDVSFRIEVFKSSILKINRDIMEVIEDNNILDGYNQKVLGNLLLTVTETIFDYLNRMEKSCAISLPRYLRNRLIKDTLVIDKESNDPKAFYNVWNNLCVSHSSYLHDGLIRLKNLIGSLLTLLNAYDLDKSDT